MLNSYLRFQALTVSSIIIIFLPAFSIHAEPTATDVIKTLDAKLRGKSSQGRFEITIIRPRTERTLVIDAWEETASKRSFIRIIRPKKDSGITFLKVDQNLWQYIPKIGKEIKIEGSLMQDSWMGSDMTNDDLVRATSIIDDYSHNFLKSNRNEFYRIELVPKPDAAVIWSRVIMDVRKSDSMPVRDEFYDHKNRLSRIMEYSEYRTMGGKFIPTHYIVRTIKANRETSSTSMKFVNVVFDAPIGDYIFSKANLRR